MKFEGKWEKRWHPLLQEWVILAATTSERPWSGDTVKNIQAEEPAFDPKCYLCPGVTRASGVTNDNYTEPWAFTNDFASFSLDAPDVHRKSKFETVEPVHGTNRVICYSPVHNVTLAEMPEEQVAKVVALWQKEYATLSVNPKIENVLIFENKGRAIGVSNPHPHGQIYATNFVPRIVERQRQSFADYYRENKSHLLVDLLADELSHKKRVVYENDHFVAFIPFFARFVYETYVVPRRQVARITDLNEAESKSLANMHKVMLSKFDNLYNMSFPNITMLQNAPCNGHPDNELFHFHIEFYPPLRSPDKLKYLAGFESGGGNIINPVLPDEAALALRNAKY
ncbi:MAG TPA: galactose-1-phosphate uridylyltransferase [Bacteroidales bacterium]|nr:galactose-1-phosphate uridylyltransferase [Bacteroidales bacterium]